MTDRSGATRPPDQRDGDRVCALCGSSLGGRRIDARVCSDPCRIEASRLRRLLAGETVGPYRSVADRLRAARSRTRTPLSDTDDSWSKPPGDGRPGSERSGVAKHRAAAPALGAAPGSEE